MDNDELTIYDLLDDLAREVKKQYLNSKITFQDYSYYMNTLSVARDSIKIVDHAIN